MKSKFNAGLGAAVLIAGLAGCGDNSPTSSLTTGSGLRSVASQAKPTPPPRTYWAAFEAGDDPAVVWESAAMDCSQEALHDDSGDPVIAGALWRWDTPCDLTSFDDDIPGWTIVKVNVDVERYANMTADVKIRLRAYPEGVSSGKAKAFYSDWLTGLPWSYDSSPSGTWDFTVAVNTEDIPILRPVKNGPPEQVGTVDVGRVNFDDTAP